MTASDLLSQARIKVQRIAELPSEVRPRSPDQAYDVQDSLIPQLLSHFGGETIGYKIACTNEIAQRQLHTDGPFFGRLLSATTHPSPAIIHSNEYCMRVMEAEFAFRMASDLPPTNEPYTPEQIADAVEGVLPGIEIVDSRFESWTTIGTPSLIADNACHAAWVCGPIVTNWRSLDLAAQKVRLIINGTLKGEGSGAAVLGHPLNALTWLANALNARGLGLRAGDFITTGVTTDIYQAGPGDKISADFGPVGKVELSLV